jgi:hypothetical protein
MQKRSKKKAAVKWHVARAGVRFTVKKGRKPLRDKDGRPRTFRTRDAAARVARERGRRR